jgi:hypothetical protein
MGPCVAVRDADLCQEPDMPDLPSPHAGAPSAQALAALLDLLAGRTPAGVPVAPAAPHVGELAEPCLPA